MLEHYYVRPTTADRIRALWLGPSISRYAEWLSDRQIGQATALFKLRVVIHFDRFVATRRVEALEELPAQIDPFIKQWRQARERQYHSAGFRRALLSCPQRAIDELLRLALPGFIGTDRSQPWPMQDLAPGYHAHLRDERGLSSHTMHSHEHHLKVLERFLAAEGITDLASLTPSIINRFLQESSAHLQPESRRSRACALRVLMRYLHRQGLLASDLSRAVPRGRIYKNAAIPRAIAWSEIERVLASVDQRSVVGKRDYAMLMLLATYGLRAQEVAALELAAIDWEGSRFHVLSRKAGNSTTYPLAAPVGQAIIEYLRNGRPQCDDRHVFVRASAPFSALSHWSVSQRAAVHLHRAGIKIYRAGSHTFRHSCVQRMVDADVPFKQIGDFVGHRSQETTRIYAKVDMNKLRALTAGEAEDML